MNTLFLDIETIPTEEEARRIESLALSIMTGNETEAEKSDQREAFDEEIKRASLSALTGRILCLGYALNDDGACMVTAGDGKEEVILQGFWMMAKNANLLVGYNILDFDLKFIWQRSILLGVKPMRDIPFTRFRQAPVYDCLQEWNKWQYQGKVSLDALARALGIESPKADGMDGSKVYEAYCAGELEKIFDYCKRDVETVRRIYHRIRG